jgi:recombinational DNA repair ATPase RecF
VRIIGLQIENFQKIKVMWLEPKGNVIKITGANAAGKTSVLDAIWLALLGTRGGPSQPVRTGAGHAVVRVDIDEYRVTRKWMEGGDSRGEMWIEAKDGRRYGTPQKLLDAMMGKLTFDPLGFMRMDAKEQALEMRRLLDLDDILEQLGAKVQVDYNTRTDQTKMLKALEAQRLLLQYPEGLPKKKRDIDAMTQELADVASYNMAIERERMDREREGSAIEKLYAAVEDRAKRIDELKAEIERLHHAQGEDKLSITTREMAQRKLKPLAEPKDAQKISEDIAAARAINTAIDRKIEADAKDAEIVRVTQDIEKLSRSIDENRKKASDVIAKAQYPVPGLGFNDGEVFYNGLPFTQASNAEQIKVSIAMGMIGNPKLRVMRIKDGSLLDSDSMAVVEDMAAKNDFQVFMEVVDESGKVGVYLQDGEIAAIDGEKQPAPPSKGKTVAITEAPAPRKNERGKKDSNARA